MRQALVVRGGWEGHQPVEATELFIPFLKDNDFSVRVSDSPSVYAEASYMASVDLIVQSVTMSTIAPDELEGLLAAVSGGAGFAGWHGGICDSYRASSDYLQLVGGQFATHASRLSPSLRSGDMSDNYVSHTINIASSDHPITAGLKDFELYTEQYWVLTDDYNDVLATTTTATRPWGQWSRPITAPAVWTRQWGSGRVFVCTPGHRVEVLEDENVRTIVERGLLWGGPMRVGIVGAGKISAQYSETLSRFPSLPVTAVADLSPDRATALVAQHPGAAVMSLDELCASPDVDVVLNLTTPAGHAPVALAAIKGGKHVYGEKPLAPSLVLGESLLDAASSAGVRLACAPDTVLGAGIQTALGVLDSGAIGAPHAATAFMTTPGHERWHPDPEFYYQPGGGPVLDMGPYYLTTLVHLLGPVVRVSGASVRPQDTRTIGSGPKAGESFPVTINTHTAGFLAHASGAVTTVMFSFDTWAARLPHIEVYGDSGSLSVPDPNRFDGDVEVFTRSTSRWTAVPWTAGYQPGGRGVGLADLAEALDTGIPHRAGADVALHVLEVMLALESGEVTDLTTTCTVPARVPRQLTDG